MIATTYALPDILVFAVAALCILLGAVGVIAAKNPVHAALSLILALLGVSVASLEQSADFLAAVEVIVYAGAIVVLFLFVIMFLGVDASRHPRLEPLVGQRGLAAAGVVVTVEPGVYVAGVGGVRIEDTLVVTADGAEPLTRFTKDVVA